MSNADVNTSKPRAKFFKVKSFTTKGVEYNVRHLPDGAWVCNCPRQISKKDPCKHIKVAQEMERYPLEAWRWSAVRARVMGEAK
jgi:hypothetical protein